MEPKEYLKEPYARVVIPDEAGGYYAEILEFPGCFAEGDSVEEAYKELEEAAESWIEVRLSQEQDVPQPFSNLDYSGTISLRIPRSMHKRAAMMAERDRTSLNTYLVGAVANRIGAEDLYAAMATRLAKPRKRLGRSLSVSSSDAEGLARGGLHHRCNPLSQ